MHTAPGHIPFVGRVGPRERGLLLLGLLLLLGVLLAAPRAGAQADFPGVPEDSDYNVRVYPPDFWGPRAGPGLGAGLVLHNLTRRNDQWLLTVAPALHEQVATASFASANPYRAQRYLLVDGRALHTDRDWTGLDDRGERIVVERTSVRARLRAGQAFLEGRGLLQPSFSLSHHIIDAVQPNVAAPDLLSPSRTAALPSAGTNQTGLRAGLDVQFDARDHRRQATSGVLLRGSVSRYVGLAPSDLTFDRLDLATYGYVPLGGLHRLALRLSSALTANRTRRAIPLNLRPRLGGSDVPGLRRGEFAAAHTMLSSLLYRFPLRQYGGLATIEGHLGVHLAGAYDDLSDQFTTRIAFDETDRTGSVRPLRPAASVGFRFVVPARDHASVEFAVGTSPNALTSVRLTFDRPIQALRPPHHTLSGEW